VKKKCLNCGKEIYVKPSQVERKKFCSRTCKTDYQKKNPPLFWKEMSKKKQVICSFCGKEMFRKPSEIRNKNFCNRQCRRMYLIANGHKINQHLKKQVEKTCEVCGQKFSVPKNRELSAKFCSRHCLGKANGQRAKAQYKKRIIVICNNCGSEIEKKLSVVRNLNFCSIQCMGDYYEKSGMFTGENSGTWAGGDIEYYGPNWRSQRRKARERDNFTCQDCGITEEEYGQELSVHHIIPFRAFNGDWEKANDLSNLITLCEHPCHRKRHSKETWLKI
jgi:uncharacterized Zn-finger protein